MAELILAVSDFVAVFNQTINYAYPSVAIIGELSQFRISKNRWVYFDLKDDESSVRFFGTVYQLPGPLEEGMVLTVRGVPQLHPKFGFSITIQTIQLSGEGTIKRAAQLLEAKLEKEGLFEPSRKRLVPFPPQTIGLITSGESAAYADFIKILQERWGGVRVQLYDVQVQGESAPGQIVGAIDYFNSHAVPPDVLVITRGGGSTDDLQAFNTEAVTRAVAASRIPAVVAIGHEVDISLAERAADVRASTPSNAAQLLVPDRREVLQTLKGNQLQLQEYTRATVQGERYNLKTQQQAAKTYIQHQLTQAQHSLVAARDILELVNPATILKRGYAIIRKSGTVIRTSQTLQANDKLDIQLHDGIVSANVIQQNTVQ